MHTLLKENLFLQRLNSVLGTNYIGTLLIDMDDVLADFGEAWLQLYNELYDDNLSKSSITQWDLAPLVKPECGHKIYDLMKHPGLFRYLKPMPYAQEVVQRLHDARYNIMIVSDSPMGHAFCDYQKNSSLIANPADDKRAWLLEYFPMIPKQNVIFGSQKYYVRGDVLIDDKPETYEICTALGQDVILMDQPYNKHIPAKMRAHNLLEVEQFIYRHY
ncbi:MAG: hypothetical protein ACI35P_05790 [Bacillus sp. (in: firmicutes)]